MTIPTRDGKTKTRFAKVNIEAAALLEDTSSAKSLSLALNYRLRTNYADGMIYNTAISYECVGTGMTTYAVRKARHELKLDAELAKHSCIKSVIGKADYLHVGTSSHIKGHTSRVRISPEADLAPASNFIMWRGAYYEGKSEYTTALRFILYCAVAKQATTPRIVGSGRCVNVLDYSRAVLLSKAKQGGRCNYTKLMISLDALCQAGILEYTAKEKHVKILVHNIEDFCGNTMHTAKLAKSLEGAAVSDYKHKKTLPAHIPLSEKARISSSADDEKAMSIYQVLLGSKLEKLDYPNSLGLSMVTRRDLIKACGISMRQVVSRLQMLEDDGLIRMAPKMQGIALLK